MLASTSSTSDQRRDQLEARITSLSLFPFRAAHDIPFIQQEHRSEQVDVNHELDTVASRRS